MSACRVRKTAWLCSVTICAAVIWLTFGEIPQNVPADAQQETRVPGEGEPQVYGIPAAEVHSLESRRATAPSFSPADTILRQAAAGTPLPGTYGPGDVERFARLRAALPANSIIPRVRTPDEQAEYIREQRELHNIHRRIYARSAAADEIDRYFASMRKSAEDALELATYLEDNAAPGQKATFQTMRAAAQQMIVSCEEDRLRAHAGEY